MPVEFCFALLGRVHRQDLRSSQDLKTNISNKTWLLPPQSNLPCFRPEQEVSSVLLQHLALLQEL